MKRLLACILFMATLLCLTGCPAPDNGGGPTTTGDGAGSGQPQSISFSGDFTVAGADADALTAALADTGIMAAEGGAAKTVAVGEGSLPVTASAKALVNSREANYGDFALVCDGTNLAVYGATAYATGKAIAYLLEAYASGNAITVPENLSYLHQPTLSTSTVAGHALKDLTVVYQSEEMAADAAELAQAISALCGYEITAATAHTGPAILLTATGEAGVMSPDYTLSCTDTALTVTAPNPASLSAAARHLLTYLPTASFSAGDSLDKSFVLRTVYGNDTAAIKYCGTWQATVENDPQTMVSYWNAAYAEIEFTGRSITVEFAQSSYYMYRIDGGAYSTPTTATGSVTFHATGEGERHILRIYSNARGTHMYIRGFSVPAFESLSRPAAKKHYIQFVGDSISDAKSSYSYHVGDVLDWDFSVTAISGMALQTGRGFWKNVNPTLYEELQINVGMEDAFFRLGPPTTADYYEDKWKIDYTSGNTPDIVFIFLGTNDELYYHMEGNAESYIEHYETFVGEILEAYGEDTQICCLQALTTSGFTKPDRFQIVRAAAENLINVYGDDNIAFIDSDVVNSWNVEISSDTTHPTAEGYATLTEEISALLAEWYE